MRLRLQGGILFIRRDYYSVKWWSVNKYAEKDKQNKEGSGWDRMYGAIPGCREGLRKTTKSLRSVDRICRLVYGRSEVQGKIVPGSGGTASPFLTSAPDETVHFSSPNPRQKKNSVCYFLYWRIFWHRKVVFVQGSHECMWIIKATTHNATSKCFGILRCFHTLAQSATEV
jgi:hypothetical protein